MDRNTNQARRRYHRRSDDERIAELEQKIVELKARQSAKERKSDPVIREIPKIQRRLRKFAQLATDHHRLDIANSIRMFNAGLERVLRSELGQTVPASAPTEEDEAS